MLIDFIKIDLPFQREEDRIHLSNGIRNDKELDNCRFFIDSRRRHQSFISFKNELKVSDIFLV